MIQSDLPIKLPCYYWSGISSTGKKIKGEIEVKNKTYAMVYLKKQGIYLIKIRRKYDFFTKKIPKTYIIMFLRQLSILTKAGIPIVQACYILNKNDNFEFTKMLQMIKKEIESGNSLASSLKKFPFYFDLFVYHLIHLGEQTGTLSHTLSYAANYKEKNFYLKKQIKQALFYPAIICSTAIGTSLLMLIFIIPRFSELFQSMHHQLPFYTRIILMMSKIIRENILLLLFLPLTGCIFFFHQIKRSLSLRHKIDKITLKLPLIGDVIHKIILSRFSRNFAMSISAGLTILSTLTLLITCSNNTQFRQSVEKLQQDITRGMQLNVSMQNLFFFPHLMIQMIKVGEESGHLSDMLEKIALVYEEEVNHFIHHLKNLMEPLIIIILGVLIGSLVVAIYLPIFKLGSII